MPAPICPRKVGSLAVSASVYLSPRPGIVGGWIVLGEAEGCHVVGLVREDRPTFWTNGETFDPALYRHPTFAKLEAHREWRRRVVREIRR